MNKDGSYRLSKWANVSKLNHLFKQGVPSNRLEEAGLLIHCFDGTENWGKPYLPCATGFCHNAERWWSGSIINANLRAAFGDSAIILAPRHNELMCSYNSDAGTLYSGCGNKGRGYFAPNATEAMLRGHSSRGGAGYNEVIINSKMFADNMPKSVAGIVYGLMSNGELVDKVRAHMVYVRMLDRYNLSEAEFPLLQANYSTTFPWTKPIHGPAFVDVGAKARAFLEAHPMNQVLDKWHRNHPFLKDHPELLHEWMRKRNEAELARQQDQQRRSGGS